MTAERWPPKFATDLVHDVDDDEYLRQHGLDFRSMVEDIADDSLHHTMS